jgi:8-oxo-dGTP diphosphatase
MINLRNEDSTMSQSQQTLHVVGAILLEGDRVLVARRAPHKSAAGLWEFPGGKVEPGESPSSALVREIEEELALKIEALKTFDVSETLVGDTVIRLEVIICQVIGDFTGKSSDHDSFMWAAAADLESLKWPEPDLPAVAALAKMESLSELRNF